MPGHFSIAWQALVDRFKNDHIIVAKYLDSIIDISFVKHDDIKSLKNVYDIVSIAADSLKTLNHEIRSVYLVQTLVRKFDKSLRVEWEKKNSGEKNFPHMTPSLSF